MKKIFMAMLSVVCLFLSTDRTFAQREKLLMDFNWKFHLGNAASIDEDFNYGMDAIFAKAGSATGAIKYNFDDSAWRTVHVPHDWAVELDFVKTKDEDVESHGYKPIGRQFPATTIGWYRKSFVVSKDDEGKRIEIKFDGVFRDCTVWLNEHYIGRNLSGYSEFSFDVSDYVKYGRRNVLVVRVDASNYEGWFYEGAGIYRHVWLIKNQPLHIPDYGVFVKTEVNNNNAVISAETKVFNQTDVRKTFELETSIIDKEGKVVASMKAENLSLTDYKTEIYNHTIKIKNPKLWSLEDPYLYTLVSTIKEDGKLVDERRTEFGVRTVTFDKDKGFFLNGKHIKVQGVCNHQDHAGVGSALPDGIQYYRIKLLKEMGVNAYRTSHNPPTNELLEACDKLGMLVLDENRLMGSSPDMLGQFETQILRDRNHPCIIAWSIGNEEFAIQNSTVGKKIAESLVRLQKKLDPTRLSTYAGNNGNSYEGINQVVPIRGFNYMNIANIDKYRQEHPDQILWGSEEASTLCTRGIFANDTVKGYVSDYDINIPGWGCTAERWWKFFDARDFLAGAFVWTGFDYRGEPTPYAWPCINSHFGIMDVCGFPKTNYFYYQSWWTNKDVLHIAPHWNWKGKEGQPINVWVETNCESVELFLNGKSLGTKKVEKDSHLEWNVNYEPGVLEAKGIKEGRTIYSKVETTGEPVNIILTPDKYYINNDGEDVSVINVTATDAQGRDVPTADNLIQFEVSDGAAIIGVGNGDPSSHEADKYLSGNYKRSLFNGKCQVIIQSSNKDDGKPVESGRIILKAVSAGLKEGTVTFEATKTGPRPYASTINKDVYQHFGYKKKVTYLSTYSDKYSGGGNGALTDGVFGTKDYTDGQWQGFEKEDASYIIDLGNVININKVETGFLQNIDSWIFFPTEVSYSFSSDGTSYSEANVIKCDVPLNKGGELIKKFSLKPGLKARYIKVSAKSIGVCPDWHKGHGGAAWLFVDETVVE